MTDRSARARRDCVYCIIAFLLKGALIYTRSSATAERQRVSYMHAFLGSLTDRAQQLVYNYID